MANPDPIAMPPPPAPLPKKHGCFFYGCITSLILLFVLAVGLFFGVRYALNAANGWIVQYADTSPMPLPTVQLPPEEMTALLERINAFSDALDAHTNAAPLVLTGQQVNALLATRPELAAFKGKFLVSFEGGQTKAQISLPLETIPIIHKLKAAKGRFLNGSGTFNLSITNGVLSVFLTSLEAKGQALSAHSLASLQSVNLAESQNNGPNATVFKQIENLQVTNSTLRIQAKTN